MDITQGTVVKNPDGTTSVTFPKDVENPFLEGVQAGEIYLLTAVGMGGLMFQLDDLVSEKAHKALKRLANAVKEFAD